MSLRLAGGGRVTASALWAWGTACPCSPAGGRPTQTQGSPASFSPPGGWGGLGLRLPERRGRRPAEVLVMRLGWGGAHLPSHRPNGAPVPGRSPSQAALSALEAHKPFAAGEPNTFRIAGPRVRLVPSTWDSSQQGLTREGCLRRGLGLAPLHPALHHPQECGPIHGQ